MSHEEPLTLRLALLEGIYYIIQIYPDEDNFQSFGKSKDICKSEVKGN